MHRQKIIVIPKKEIIMKHKLTESLEKYLLAVYEIVKTNKAARVKDVSNYLNIGGPATSEAIKKLAEFKYINYAPYGIITITPNGEKYAKTKILRHNTITNFLDKVLMIDGNILNETADSIEYSMTDDVLDKFVCFLSFMENCSCKKPKWVKSYEYFSKNGEMQEKCKVCISNRNNFDNSKCCSSSCV